MGGGKRLPTLLLLAFAAIIASTGTSAQDHPNIKRGVNGPTLYDFSDVDAVNLFNGQLSLRIPIASFRVNGSLSYEVAVQYSSNIFDYEYDGVQELSTPNPHSNAGLGWMLFFDAVYSPGSSPINDTSLWLMVDGDGSRHLFYNSIHADDEEPLDSHYRYSRDGSYLRMHCTETTGDCSTAGLTQIEIESPDGLIRVFEDDPEDSQVWQRGRLTKIQDRFGNSITFTYSNLLWTISDGHRSTNVYFDAQFGGQVDRVEVPSFSGGTAIYDFSYDPNPRLVGTPDPTPVWLLQSILLPDGSTWAMEYVPTPSDEPRILQLYLPTGGRYEWDYGIYVFPGTSVQPEFLKVTTGVIAKRGFDVDDGQVSEWEYIHDPVLSEPSEVSTTVRATLQFEDAADPVATPLIRNDTKYYFRDSHTASEPHWTHGLPFTFRIADPTTHERHLSVDYFEGLSTSGPLKRSEYVRYTADATPNGLGSNLNQRLEKKETVYSDDGDRFIDVTLSDFDGLGHFRTVNRSGLGDTVGRTETTRYNPDAGSYDCTSTAGPISCTPEAFAPPDSAAAWILSDFDLRSQGESGDTASQLFCFDTGTGFLDRIWTMVGSEPGATDVVQVLTADAANGNVKKQEFFGGDAAPLSSTADPCNVSLGTPSYRFDHTYSYGSLMTSRYRDSAGLGGPNGELDFFVVDNTTATGASGIDQNTGLVKASKDVSGIRTDYNYDSMGRLTEVDPEPGHGGTIKHVYTPFNPSSGALADVVTQYKNEAESANLAVRRIYFDGLGRAKLQGGDVAGTGAQISAIEYNGVGWVKSVSPLGYPTKKTQYSNYDPFGRPRKITPPDGSSHDVDLIYSGVRQVERKVRIEQETGEQQVSTFERYDEQGRLVEVEESSSPTGGAVLTQYAYDVGNRLESVTTGQQVRTFNYDHRGFLLGGSHPETGSFTYSSYDARGWALAASAGGHAYGFTYDGAERLRDVTADGLPYKTFTYGTSADGGEQLGRLVQTVRHNYVDWDGSGVIDRPVAEFYTFDGPGGRVSRKDTSISAVGSFTQDFSYSDLGRIDSLDYPCFGSAGSCDTNDPAPSRQVARTFTKGYLTGVTGYASISYHPNGHVYQVQNQVQSPEVLDLVYCMALHGIPRPSGISLDFEPRNPTDACNAPSLAYAYDGAGNVKQMGGETYYYDKVGRIKHVTTGEGFTQDYDYDEFGNLVHIDTMKEGQTQSSPRDFSVDNKNQLLSANYDPAGNLTEYPKGMPAEITLDWDALGTVTRAHSGSVDYAYLYTADDERVATKERSSWGSFAYTTLRDLGGQVIREYVDSSPDDIMADGFESGDLECWSAAEGGPPAGGGCPKPGLAWRRDHVYRDGALLASDLPQPSPNDRIFHYLNHQGTPVRIGDNSGNIIPAAGDFFFPFGESHKLTEPVPLSPLRYTGHFRDQNGLPEVWDDLDQMHARYFGAHFGRFMSPDPIVAANPRFPQSWNQYAYVYNSPVSFVDPFGLQGEGDPRGTFNLYIDVVDNFLPGGVGTATRDSLTLWRLSSWGANGGGGQRALDLLVGLARAQTAIGRLMQMAIDDELCPSHAGGFQFDLSSVNPWLSRGNGGGVYGLNLEYIPGSGYSLYRLYTPLNALTSGLDTGIAFTLNVAAGNGPWDGGFNSITGVTGLATYGGFHTAPDEVSGDDIGWHGAFFGVSAGGIPWGLAAAPTQYRKLVDLGFLTPWCKE